MPGCPFSSSVHLGAQPVPATCPFSGSAAVPSMLKGQGAVAQPPQHLLGPDSQHRNPPAISHSSSTGSIADSDVSCPSSSVASDTSDSCSTSSVFQAWHVKRPNLQHDPKLTRRQLRRLGRTWSLSDVAQHKYCDDGWIAVDGRVYDITEHIALHPGWDSGCRVTEVLSILAHLGCDCSEEFHEIHRSYPVSYKQLAAYYIGDLAP